MMSAEELSCSVCYELPTGEVHQCSRGHFLCVSCWNDIDKLPSRVCPECRVPLPRANRCRVAELAIKHLPRPEGYTTPPPVRPNNRGDPLTPLLQNPLSNRELEDKLIEMDNRLRIALHDLEAAGNAAFKEGRFDEAATHFTSAVNATPKHYTATSSDAMLFSNRSDAFLSLGRYEEALADAERVMALRPEWWKGFSLKGDALHRLGRYAEAIVAYEAGLRAEPGITQIHFRLALLASQRALESGPPDSE